MEICSQHIAYDTYLKRLERADMAGLASGFLPAEVATRMLQSLDLITMNPKFILDVSHYPGHTYPVLQQRYSDARCVHLAPVIKLAESDNIIGQAENIALPAASVDLIISNLSFDWQCDLMQCFKQFSRVLKPGGLLLFSMYGPDTLQELRYAFSQVDQQQHVHAFFDMHDIGDWLTQSALVDPVMSKEMITLRYKALSTLCSDLKSTLSQNALSDRDRGLMGKRHWQSMLDAYEVFRDAGKLPASFEIIVGHAWKPLHSQAIVGDEVRIPISSVVKHKT